MERWTAAGAVLGFAALAGAVFYLVAGPVLDNDVWWHLAHGRAYLEHGPWLAEDPCLGTAERGPIPHSWLFDAAAGGIEQLGGIQTLRAFHALACVWIGVLAWSTCRRESASLAPAALATGVFLVLAWYRAVQVRPEVLSIAFTLLLHRWLFAPSLPSWRNVALAIGTVALWANAHALFLVGPLLVLAALAGAGVRVAAAAIAGFDAGDDRRRAGRLAVALAGSLLASLANPRGIDQHLAYLESSGAGAIQTVYDEWAPFSLLAANNPSPAVSPLATLAVDVTALAVLAAVAVGIWRFLREPTREALDGVDPVRLALAVAGAVALATAIRFVWLGVFALFFLLHALKALPRERARRVDAACAAVAIAFAASFPIWGGFEDVARLYPKRLADWIAQGHTGGRFFETGVRFLEESGVEGQVFNDYALGGYLCHRTDGAVRTFVDGSMNYPESVSVDYRNAVVGRGSRSGESLSAALDRRGVDLFFGFGVPVGDGGAYSTTALAGHPDWRLVSRSWRHAVYLRANAANDANLARIAEWYASQGVPFDPALGFEPGRVLAERREWADAWELWPPGWSELLAQPRSKDLAERVRELERIGLGYALSGAWEAGVRSDRRAAALRPRAQSPRRRLVWNLLRLGRVEQALARSRELVELDPGDPRSARFAEVARRVDTAPSVDARNRALDTLPLLSSRQPLRQ